MSSGATRLSEQVTTVAQGDWSPAGVGALLAEPCFAQLGCVHELVIAGFQFGQSLVGI